MYYPVFGTSIFAIFDCSCLFEICCITVLVHLAPTLRPGPNRAGQYFGRFDGQCFLLHNGFQYWAHSIRWSLWPSFGWGVSGWRTQFPSRIACRPQIRNIGRTPGSNWKEQHFIVWRFLQPIAFTHQHTRFDVRLLLRTSICCSWVCTSISALR